MATKSAAKVESLTQRLGKLDKERRAILKELKMSPEYGLKFLNDKLISFTSDNSAKWFSRAGEKSGVSYWKMISFKVTSDSKTATITRDKSSLLANVQVTWDVYYENTNVKTQLTETIKLAAYRDLEGQILNGRKLAANFDERKVVKAALNEKKKALEEQLKVVKEDLAKIK